MFGIFKKYKRLFGRDAARSFNLMAAFLTNLCGDESINIDRPDDPSSGNPPCISVNLSWLLSVCLPKVSSTGLLYSTGGDISTKSIGTTSGTIAAGDHTHTTSDITDWATATADFLTLIDLSTALSGYATSSHTHAYSTLTGTPDLSGILDTNDIGDTVQAYSSSLTALASSLDNDGKVPLSMLTGNINGHSGTCYVTIDNYGNLGHSENLAYNLLNAAKTANASALATDKNLGNGLQYASSEFSVKTRSGYGLTCDGYGLALTTLTADKWMKTDANGLPTTTNDTPAAFTSTPTSGRAVLTDGTTGGLTVASGGVSTPKTVVTGVTWNGTQLVVARESWSFTGGILTHATSLTNTTIDTVAYSP